MTPDGTEIWDLVWQTGSALATIAALAGLIWWFVAPRVKSWFGGLITSVRAVESHTQQLTPNNGSHVADKVTEAVRLSQETLDAVGELRGRMDTIEHRHDRDLAEVWRTLAQRPTVSLQTREPEE